MPVIDIHSLEHLKKDENIKNGLFFCPKCEIIFSAYYLRTFSVHCVRNANYARCLVCESENKGKVKRLSRNLSCPDCNSKIEHNIWQKMCGTELVKMDLISFEKFCLKAAKQFSLNIHYDKNIFEYLFDELSESDFTSIEQHSETGYDYGDIAILIRKASDNLRKREEKLSANFGRFA